MVGKVILIPQKIQIDDDGLTLDSMNYDFVDISTILSTDITPSTFYTVSLSLIWANNLNGDLFFVELDSNGLGFNYPNYRDHQIHGIENLILLLLKQATILI